MRIFISILIMLFINSCAQVNYPSFTDGSKSDAVVTMTYEYPNSVNPNDWDWSRYHESAVEKCQNWGYLDAVKFDRGKRFCIAVNGYGHCVYWQESLNYQCIDILIEQDTIPARIIPTSSIKENNSQNTLDAGCVSCPWPNGNSICNEVLGSGYECTGLGQNRCCTLSNP
mgnify:CR=1 FL=1